MKILIISDEPPKQSILEVVSQDSWIELIITLGDLYEFDIKELKEIKNIPKIWVYWNHCSWVYFEEFGIKNMHLETFELNWITFWWFEWCVRYKEKWRFQYTQDEAKELLENFPKVDVFLSHCPPFWINYNNDEAHTWFEAIKEYIEKNKPKYVLHWHTYNKWNFVDKYLGTEIVYVKGARVVEVG